MVVGTSMAFWGTMNCQWSAQFEWIDCSFCVVRSAIVRCTSSSLYSCSSCSLVGSTLFFLAFSIFVIYTAQGQILTVDKAFTTMSLLNIMLIPLIILPYFIGLATNAIVSAGRIVKFLTSEEINLGSDWMPNWINSLWNYSRWQVSYLYWLHVSIELDFYWFRSSWFEWIPLSFSSPLSHLRRRVARFQPSHGRAHCGRYLCLGRQASPLWHLTRHAGQTRCYRGV